MAIFVPVARIVILAAALCCGLARANAHPSELSPSSKNDGDDGKRVSSEPFGRQLTTAPLNDFSAKWAELQSRILAEQGMLAACRSGQESCPAAARLFLRIIELGRQHEGRARLGEINRAVNLSIKPVSDWAQYGTADFWSAPLDTLRTGAGDCEDYAIVKYVALRDAGVTPDDLRLVIVRDVRRNVEHAVVAVRNNDEWLILDNRTLMMVNADEARHYFPLFMLDERGVRAVWTAARR